MKTTLKSLSLLLILATAAPAQLPSALPTLTGAVFDLTVDQIVVRDVTEPTVKLMTGAELRIGLGLAPTSDPIFDALSVTSIAGAGTGLTGTASGLTAGNSTLSGGQAVGPTASPTFAGLAVFQGATKRFEALPSGINVLGGGDSGQYMTCSNFGGCDAAQYSISGGGVLWAGSAFLAKSSFGFVWTSGNFFYDTADAGIFRSSAGVLEINNGTLGGSGHLQTHAAYLGGSEMTAPAAPATNGYRIFAEDNGSGKTRLMVKFATGAAQQIAIEP